MAKKPSKAVAKKEDAGSPALPEYMQQYAGEGQEDIHRDDIAMPRLMLGQSMSQVVKDKHAAEGDFIHNITQDVLCAAGETIRVIPVAYSKEYILWYDRKGPKDGIAARARRAIVDGQVRYMWDKPNATFEDKVEGKILVEYVTKRFIDEDGLGDWGSQIPGDMESPPAATAHHNYVIMLPDHDNQLIAISLARSAEKKAKEWNTMLKMGAAPTYARIYKMGSFIERDGDNSWANYQFVGFELVDDEAKFLALRELHEGLKEKGINVDFSDEDRGDSTSDDGEPKKF